MIELEILLPRLRNLPDGAILKRGYRKIHSVNVVKDGKLLFTGWPEDLIKWDAAGCPMQNPDG